MSNEITNSDPGEGWEILKEGAPLLPGGGFSDPRFPEQWIDYECRPDLFKGGGKLGSIYFLPVRDYAHAYTWRRRKSSEGQP